jgi:hypothetical protein
VAGVDSSFPKNTLRRLATPAGKAFCTPRQGVNNRGGIDLTIASSIEFSLVSAIFTPKAGVDLLVASRWPGAL